MGARSQGAAGGRCLSSGHHSLLTATTTAIFNQPSFALFFFALYFMRIVVLFFVRFHLNKEFPDWKKKKELKTNDLTHPWVDLDYIKETNGIPRANCLNSQGPARAGPRPPAAWVSPVAPLDGRWGWGLFSGGNIHRAATSPLLRPDLPNHHFYYHMAAFSVCPLGEGQGLAIRGLSIFSWVQPLFQKAVLPPDA